MNTENRKNVAVYLAHAQAGGLSEGKEARCFHYKDIVEENSLWNFVGFYEDADPGLDFGTCASWNALIEKCRAGEIDIVFSKSAACFGRSPGMFYENMNLLSELGVEAVTEATGPLSAGFLASRLSACLLFNPDVLKMEDCILKQMEAHGLNEIVKDMEMGGEAMRNGLYENDFGIY